MAAEMAKSREEACAERAFARSSAVTLRGKAILPSFGFGRFGHLLRRERLENEPHFLRFRSSQLVKTIQTKLTSIMSPYPRVRTAADGSSPPMVKQDVAAPLDNRAVKTKNAAQGRVFNQGSKNWVLS
ncbi:hypothetical protein [Roseibium sp.]|uniref:hypothetical protein n=1 Tax=Roseibium sp. TaxID=1936156 RepID=UPI003BACC5B6